jgi:two-component system probable response regulator PhcQ
MHRIIIVDDEVNIINALRRIFAQLPYEIVTFTTPTEALDYATRTKVDLVISDFRMPVMDGATLLKKIKDIQPDAMRLIISGYSDRDGLVSAINDAAIYRFINKPWDEYDLVTAVANALRQKDILTENKRLADQVRKQTSLLDQQRSALQRLEQDHPGITKVRWESDGSIILDGEDV